MDKLIDSDHDEEIVYLLRLVQAASDPASNGIGDEMTDKVKTEETGDRYRAESNVVFTVINKDEPEVEHNGISNYMLGQDFPASALILGHVVRLADKVRDPMAKQDD